MHAAKSRFGGKAALRSRKPAAWGDADVTRACAEDASAPVSGLRPVDDGFFRPYREMEGEKEPTAHHASCSLSFGPLCPWDYGVDPLMRRLAAEHPILPLRLLGGNLVDRPASLTEMKVDFHNIRDFLSVWKKSPGSARTACGGSGCAAGAICASDKTAASTMERSITAQGV